MKTRSHSRRNFLNYSLLGFSTAALSLASWNKQDKGNSEAALARSDATIFISESGNLGHDPTFTLGMLLVPQVEAFEARIQYLRQELQYFPRLAYSNNDYFQLPFAKAAISWVFLESAAHFRVMNFTEPILTNHPRFGHAPSRWQVLQKKQDYYDLLLEKEAIQNQMVYVKYQSPLGPGPIYGQHFFNKRNCYYQATDTRKSNALQLSSLLTGCVAAAYENRLVSPIKQQIIDHLKDILESEQLQPASRWKDRFVFYA